MSNNSRELKVDRSDIEVRLESSRKEKKFTDVQLQIGDKLFDAHRIILSLYSPVLKAAVSDQWSTTKICPISEEYVDPEIMEDLLSFLYTGSIKLTPDNVHSICMGAHFLQIPKLLEPSVKFLCELINLENVLQLFSSSCQLDQIRYACLRFIIDNHKKVFQDSEILEFRFESLKSLLLGLKEHFWGTGLREHTFDCVVRWTERNLPERLEHLPILLENIPLVELPVDFLEETVSVHPLVKESLSGSEILSQSIANNETSWKTKENFIVIGGYERGSETYSRSMYCYNWNDGSWKQLPDISEYKYNFGVTVVNEREIIVSGGRLASSPTDKVEMFDWLTQTWTTLPKLPFPLSQHSMVDLGDHLYVAGGKLSRMFNLFDDSFDYGLGKEVLSYSFVSREWKFTKLINPLPKLCQLIPFKNYIYFLYSAALHRYNPLKKEWKQLKQPNPGTKFAKTVPSTVHLDQIYVCSMNGLEAYDPETDSWASYPVPIGRWTTVLVSVNGKLLSVGGLLNHQNQNSQTNLICEFDLESKTWKKFGKLPVRLALHRCVVGRFH